MYGVGNALVDIQARVDDALLAELDFPKGAMTLVGEDVQQQVLAALQGAPISRCAGGSAANTVLGVADLGGTAAYAGKVGNDSLGNFCLQDMRRIDVERIAVILGPKLWVGCSRLCSRSRMS